MNVLLVQSSPFEKTSYSRQTAEMLIGRLRELHDDLRVTLRDVARNPLPHFSADLWKAIKIAPADRTLEQDSLLAVAEPLIAELEEADLIVVATPMHNFGIPSALKAWIDHICLPGRTFIYTNEGSRPILPQGKRAIIVAARGGMYGMPPFDALDSQVPYLTSILEFLGIKVADKIVVEGVSISPELAEAALQMAREKVATVTA